MVVQQELVHLEVERRASIGYANNKLKEAIKRGFFFLHYFLIKVLIIFPAISLRPLPLLLVILNNSLISLLNELSLEYDSNTLLIIGATSAEPAP